MSVAVGYVATQEGRAALSAAIQEAALRKTDLQILGPVAGQGPSDSQADLRAAVAEAAAAGVTATLREGEGHSRSRLSRDRG
jgi:hypothetical protein